jgi:predicted nucleic acid-binding protein
LNLFLDSSVVLSASLSPKGASRLLFELSSRQNWHLLVSPWVLREVRDNLRHQTAKATENWDALRQRVTVEGDELIFNWPLAFDVAKDKPVLVTALACADVLLTLDRHDFRTLLGQSVYGLQVLTPGQFLSKEREAGRLA